MPIPNRNDMHSHFLWAARITVPLCIIITISRSPLSADRPAFPRLPNQGGIYVIAHRGAHTNIPENTLAAYQRAIDLGADFVEIDLRTTKDGQFVSIHNGTVDAYLTDGTKGKVRDFRLDQLRAMDIGSRVGPQWKDERVPTFDEILKLCKDKIGIYLDLKDAPVSEVAQAIRDNDMQRYVVWCIRPNQVAAVRTACPECIPMPDPISEASLPAMLRETTPQIVAPVWRDFSSTFAAKCHNAGAIVFVDEQKSSEDNWRLALEWGADGIQTDAPARLIEFLTTPD